MTSAVKYCRLMGWPPPVTLVGRTVALEPLTLDRADELREAVADGSLWHLWYTNIPQPDAVPADIERRMALTERGQMLAFAVIERSTGRAAGVTAYLNPDEINARLEIGSTWYRKSVQRTALNTEAKLLLLAHAFDTLGCIAVEFRTSSFNTPSRHAIERLGAKLDGVLRSHSRHSNGTLRDTYVYSIIAAEWPVVRANLEARLRD